MTTNTTMVPPVRSFEALCPTIIATNEAIINDEKATAIIQHITYDLLDDEYKTDIFTDATIKGKLGVNAIKTNKHLYDHVVYDSNVEKTLAENLDTSSDVAVYVKLPSGFYISTPVGKYNPDWAIAFYEDHVKHIYFVAETKGDLASLELTHTSSLEKAKIDCARQHFKAISNGDVVYDVIDGYDALLQKVMRFLKKCPTLMETELLSQKASPAFSKNAK